MFIKVSGKNSKKERNSSSNQDDKANARQTEGNGDKTLSCILPTFSKKLRLSVIIKKRIPKLKAPKTLTKIPSQKEKPKEAPKGKSMLDTLLEACEQAKEEEQQHREEKGGRNRQTEMTSEAQRMESRLRKEKEEEEKYFRMYERYQFLKEKLEKREFEVVLI